MLRLPAVGLTPWSQPEPPARLVRVRLWMRAPTPVDVSRSRSGRGTTDALLGPCGLGA